MKITEALMAEHVVFHSFFDHIERMAPQLKSVAEVRSLAAILESMMKTHTCVEDELLIEPLDHCFEQIGQRETFHQEHADIERKLVLIQITKRLKAAQKLLLETVLTARKHFDKEERIVFPLAERILNAKTLAALGRKWIEQRNALCA